MRFLRESKRVTVRKKCRSFTAWECAGVKHVVFLAECESERESVYQGNDTGGGAGGLGYSA